MKRTINEIIIHCTDTEAGREVDVDEIRRWHKARGFVDVGYHFVIHINGEVEVGRDINEVGAHCQGHNGNSVGICYVGGRKAGKPSDTRTAEQKEAMKRLVMMLKDHYNIGKVSGHNEYSNKACPCFNVKAEQF